ncbi:uncharacterized protein [Setaria viridis]
MKRKSVRKTERLATFPLQFSCREASQSEMRAPRLLLYMHRASQPQWQNAAAAQKEDRALGGTSPRKEGAGPSHRHCCQSSVNQAPVNPPSTSSASPIPFPQLLHTTTRSLSESAKPPSYPTPPASSAAEMQLLLHRSLFAAASASGRLRRALSTATPGSRPPWALIHRISMATPSPRGASLSLAPPPSPSHVVVPRRVYDTGADRPEEGCMDVLGSGAHAASAEGFLLLTSFKFRVREHPLSKLNILPLEVRARIPPFEVVSQYFSRFVCNPISGEMVRLPDFDAQEKNMSDQYLGIMTEAAGRNGPPERYAVAQLTDDEDGEGGGRRFSWRRFDSEAGKWDKLVMPSPLPSGRRMDLNHEVLAFGGRLWWVDVSWGAVSADPFSDRPELRSIKLPAGSVLPDQKGEMKPLIKRRRIGVSDGRLRYAEVSGDEPFLIKYFTLDEQSGCWTLDHQVPFAALLSRDGCCPAPLLGAIDPVKADVLYLSIDREITLAVDMRRKKVTGASPLNQVRPNKCSSSFFLPCVLTPGLASSPIPGKKGDAGNKTLAYILQADSESDEKYHVGDYEISTGSGV